MIKSTYTKSKQTYKVSFELPADQVGEKRDVRVLGTFNNWSWDNGLKMKQSKGKYSASTDLPAGDYKFRYLADGHDWKNDDSVDSYADSGYGSTDCCFSLAAVEDKKAPAKKASAKQASTTKQSTTDAAVSEDATTAKTAAKPPKATKAKKTQTSAAKAKPAKAATKKATAKKATKGDDLKRIEGIGPKIAGLLNEAGIATFDQLGKAPEKKLADVLQAAGARFRLANHKTWQEQAKLAAAGKSDELKKLQEELKGGVRK